MLKIMFVTAGCLISASIAHAKLKVVASTSDVQAIVRSVGADDIELSGIAKGSQDPHYIEAKPSYVLKLRDADLLVVNGLSLEVGWIPSLLQSARNSKISTGTKGFLDLGTLVDPIEKPTGAISRAGGDVHPDGNPHYTLDPVRVGDLALKVAERLGELDSSHREVFAKRAAEFKAHLSSKTDEWRSRIQKSGVKKIVTYHPSLNYFLARFGLEAVAFLEPKPGIPPTAQHILDVISQMKKDGVRVVLIDNFFDTKIADRVAKDVPGARVISVGIADDSSPNLKTFDDVTEQLVRAVEGK